MLNNIIIIIIFLLGIYYYCTINNSTVMEGLINSPSCPDILIQKNSHFFLYNSKLAQVPGVNPVEFENLEDYVEFMDWQRSQGINCPILYLQNTFDTQGNSSYRIRPSPTNLQGGLNPSSSIIPLAPATPISTQNLSTPNTQYEIQQNLLYSENGKSANAMDPNWGGIQYENDLIAKGVYKGDEVTGMTMGIN